MGNKQATNAVKQVQQAVKRAPTRLPLNVADKNVETDKTLYTYKEDYDMIQKMSSMTEAQRQEMIEKNNQEYRAQDEALKQLDDLENASKLNSAPQSRRTFSSLSDSNFSQRFSSQQDKTQEQVSQVAEEPEKDEQFMSNLMQLSNNIVTKHVRQGFVGEMPEFMQGKLARAKVANFAAKTAQRLTPNRDQVGEPTRQAPPVFNRYSPYDIQGTVTARDIKEFLDSVRDLRFDAEHESKTQAKEQYHLRVVEFANKRGIDPQIMHTMLHSINSLFIFNAQSTVNGLWYAPMFYKISKKE